MHVMTNTVANPTKIKRITSEQNQKGCGLEITWSDGLESTISSETLRRECPCATCMEQRGATSHSKPLVSASPKLRVLSATEEDSLNLLKVLPVGNYAIALWWADGHNS